MSWLSKIFGTGAKAVTGGVVGVATEAAKDVADIVERWNPGEEKKHQFQMEVQKMVADAQASARTYDPRTTGTGRFGENVNVMVDAVSRLIRPTVSVLLIGACIGLWDVSIQTLDPIILDWTEGVIGFWFGMRAATRDVPAMIQAIKKAMAKG